MPRHAATLAALLLLASPLLAPASPMSALDRSLNPAPAAAKDFRNIFADGSEGDTGRGKRTINVLLAGLAEALGYELKPRNAKEATTKAPAAASSTTKAPSTTTKATPEETTPKGTNASESDLEAIRRQENQSGEQNGDRSDHNGDQSEYENVERSDYQNGDRNEEENDDEEERSDEPEEYYRDGPRDYVREEYRSSKVSKPWLYNSYDDGDEETTSQTKRDEERDENEYVYTAPGYTARYSYGASMEGPYYEYKPYSYSFEIPYQEQPEDAPKEGEQPSSTLQHPGDEQNTIYVSEYPYKPSRDHEDHQNDGDDVPRNLFLPYTPQTESHQQPHSLFVPTAPSSEQKLPLEDLYKPKTEEEKKEKDKGNDKKDEVKSDTKVLSNFKDSSAGKLPILSTSRPKMAQLLQEMEGTRKDSLWPPPFDYAFDATDASFVAEDPNSPQVKPNSVVGQKANAAAPKEWTEAGYLPGEKVIALAAAAQSNSESPAPTYPAVPSEWSQAGYNPGNRVLSLVPATAPAETYTSDYAPSETLRALLQEQGNSPDAEVETFKPPVNQTATEAPPKKPNRYDEEATITTLEHVGEYLNLYLPKGFQSSATSLLLRGPKKEYTYLRPEEPLLFTTPEPKLPALSSLNLFQPVTRPTPTQQKTTTVAPPVTSPPHYERTRAPYHGPTEAPPVTGSPNYEPTRSSSDEAAPYYGPTESPEATAVPYYEPTRAPSVSAAPYYYGPTEGPPVTAAPYHEGTVAPPVTGFPYYEAQPQHPSSPRPFSRSFAGFFEPVRAVEAAEVQATHSPFPFYRGPTEPPPGRVGGTSGGIDDAPRRTEDHPSETRAGYDEPPGRIVGEPIVGTTYKPYIPPATHYGIRLRRPTTTTTTTTTTTPAPPPLQLRLRSESRIPNSATPPTGHYKIKVPPPTTQPPPPPPPPPPPRLHARRRPWPRTQSEAARLHHEEFLRHRHPALDDDYHSHYYEEFPDTSADYKEEYEETAAADEDEAVEDYGETGGGDDGDEGGGGRSLPPQRQPYYAPYSPPEDSRDFYRPSPQQQSSFTVYSPLSDDYTSLDYYFVDRPPRYRYPTAYLAQREAEEAAEAVRKREEERRKEATPYTPYAIFPSFPSATPSTNPATGDKEKEEGSKEEEIKVEKTETSAGPSPGFDVPSTTKSLSKETISRVSQLHLTGKVQFYPGHDGDRIDGRILLR